MWIFLLSFEAAPILATEKKLLAASRSDYGNFSEDLEIFAATSEELYNATVKGYPSESATVVLKKYFDLQATYLKGDLFILESYLLQCQLKNNTVKVKKELNGTFLETVKNRLKLFKHELELSWGYPEYILLCISLVNMTMHVYSLGFIARVKSYKRLTRK